MQRSLETEIFFTSLVYRIIYNCDSIIDQHFAFGGSNALTKNIKGTNIFRTVFLCRTWSVVL